MRGVHTSEIWWNARWAVQRWKQASSASWTKGHDPISPNSGHPAGMDRVNGTVPQPATSIHRHMILETCCSWSKGFVADQLNTRTCVEIDPISYTCMFETVLLQHCGAKTKQKIYTRGLATTCKLVLDHGASRRWHAYTAYRRLARTEPLNSRTRNPYIDRGRLSLSAGSRGSDATSLTLRGRNTVDNNQ